MAAACAPSGHLAVSPSRRLAFTLALGLSVALLAVVVSHDLAETKDTGRTSDAPLATFTPVGHRTYTISMQPPSLDVAWHPGERKVFTWAPEFTGFTLDDRPSPVRCSMQFFGPFPSRAAAQQPFTLPFPSGGPGAAPTPTPTLTSPPLLLDDWTSQPRTSEVTLPSTLAPGWYIVSGLVTYANGESSGANIVEITAA